MAIKLSRKGIIILVVLLIVLIAGGVGGYLAWKVNNEANLGNTDSSAGGTGTPPGCSCTQAKMTCGDCNPATGLKTCSCPGNANCGTKVCTNPSGTPTTSRCHCCDGEWVIDTRSGSCGTPKICDSHGGLNNCKPKTNNACTCTSYANCGVDCKFPDGTQQKVNAAAAGSCGKKMAFCDIDADGNTTVSIRDPGNCWAQRNVCKNPTAEETCNPGVCQSDCGTGCPTGLSCTGGKCVNPTCPTDADCTCNPGACQKACGTGCPTGLTCSGNICINAECPGDADCVCPPPVVGCNTTCTTNAQCATVNPGYQCVSGKCRNTACPTATNCQCNAAWTINKTASVACINENTPQVASKVTYSVAITFNSNGQTGTIGKVTDTFTASPVPVQASWISGIDNGGVVSGNGLVTWNLVGAAQNFTGGQTRTFSFVMTVPGAPYNAETDTSPQFGTYSNSVFADVLTPDATKDLNVDRTILVGCRVPSTGLFDSVISKTILAILLLIVGILYFTVDQFESYIVNMITSGASSVRSRVTPKGIEVTQIKKARKDFEKRMTKGS
jgi:hypothetical protein